MTFGNSWDILAKAFGGPIRATTPPVPSQHPTSLIESHLSSIHGSTTLNQPSLVNCPDCQRVVTSSAWKTHQGSCKKFRTLVQKGKKKGEENTTGTPGTSAPPSATTTLSTGKKGQYGGKGLKRRFSDVEAELVMDGPQPPKKKKKSESTKKGTPKMPRQKPGHPVDVNIQCGVLTDKGLPCARSLTCKTHSMGAKRAVVGRSDTYDILLAAWQRKNNPNYVEKKPVQPRTEKKKKKERERRGNEGERENWVGEMDDEPVAASLQLNVGNPSTLPLSSIIGNDLAGDEYKDIMERISKRVRWNEIGGPYAGSFGFGMRELPIVQSRRFDRMKEEFEVAFGHPGVISTTVIA